MTWGEITVRRGEGRDRLVPLMAAWLQRPEAAWRWDPIDAVAGAAALPNQGCQTTGRDGDAHAGGVGDAPARLLVPARASGTDQSFGLGDTADGNGLALPAIKAKDAVRFRDHLTTLQIAHTAAALLPLADVGPIEWGRERRELLGGEAGGLSLGSGASFGWGLLGAVSRADQLQG
jgi:hypothetical protein